MLSRTRLLAPVAAAASMAASLLFVADPSASAAICTTAHTVSVTESQTSSNATSRATIRQNPCNDGVEGGIETFIHNVGFVFAYGGDVKDVGRTSSVTSAGSLIKYGYRYFADKTGTGQWYYVWS